MHIRFWLRGGAALAAVSLMAIGSAAQARDLTCTVRGGYHSVTLHISERQTTAAFGGDTASPTTVTSDQIKWRGPEDEHGYAPIYEFNRNTGALIRTGPMLFNNGLTSMWPTTYDCAGSPSRVD